MLSQENMRLKPGELIEQRILQILIPKLENIWTRYTFRKVGNINSNMEKVKISVAHIEQQMKKMKKNKAPCPDNIKIEVYKALLGEKAIFCY